MTNSIRKSDLGGKIPKNWENQESYGNHKEADHNNTKKKTTSSQISLMGKKTHERQCERKKLKNILWDEKSAQWEGPKLAPRKDHTHRGARRVKNPKKTPTKYCLNKVEIELREKGKPRKSTKKRGKSLTYQSQGRKDNRKRTRLVEKQPEKVS